MKKNTQMELRRHHGTSYIDGVRPKTSPALDDRRSEDGKARGGAKSNTTTKVRLLKVLVWSVAIYGSEG